MTNLLQGFYGSVGSFLDSTIFVPLSNASVIAKDYIIGGVQKPRKPPRKPPKKSSGKPQRKPSKTSPKKAQRKPPKKPQKTPKIDPEQLVVSADEIIPGLWIGNQASAESDKWLKSKDIKVVINASKHIEFASVIPNAGKFRVFVDDPGPWKGIRDPDVAEMRKMLPKVIDYIHRARNAGYNVLIHCHAGMQRSAAIMVAYLAKHIFISTRGKKYSLDKAESYLKSKRHIVFYNGQHMNFRAAVEDYIFNS